MHIRLCQGESMEDIIAGANSKPFISTGER